MPATSRTAPVTNMTAITQLPNPPSPRMMAEPTSMTPTIALIPSVSIIGHLPNPLEVFSPRPAKEPTDTLLKNFPVLRLGDDVERAGTSGPKVEGNHPGPQFVPEPWNWRLIIAATPRWPWP